ncbi:MAG: hypothetical protein WC216_11820 [Gallionella sp.]
MDYSMLAVLLTGIFILVAGILIYRGPGESMQSAVRDAVAWGTGFFVAFGGEMRANANY